MARLSADVALPKVEQIHVVGDGLAALNLEDDPRSTKWPIPVGP